MLPVWGNCSLNMADKIQTTQNKILKMIYRKPKRFSTSAFYREIVDSNVLMFKHLFEFESSVLVYKIKHKMIHINTKIPLNAEIHQRNLRSANLLRLPNYSTTAGRKSLLYKGTSLFNMLPDNIKNSPLLKDFKVKLRRKYRNSLIQQNN